MEVVTEKPTTKVVPKGYKRTEVGVIPEDWEVCKQKEVVEYINGRAYSKDEWENSGVPVVRLQNLTGSGDKYYYSTLNLPQKNYMHNGDLIFMWSASFGPYIWSGPKAIFHYHIWKINCDKDLVDKVFYYFKLLELTEALKQNTSGSTMLHLTKTSMEEYKIALPETLEEQQVIAESLSDVDALIAELDALIEKKQQIKKGAMQQLLSGKKRLPGFDGEWEEKRLGDVARVQRGASPRPISSPKWFSLEKDVGWVRISDISDSDGKNLLKTKDYLSKAGIERSRFLPKGSLILSIAATVGLPVITRIDTCIHDGFVGLTNLEVDQEFLYYKLKELENDLVEMGQTGSQNNINSTIVRNVEAFFPPREEQKAIARTLSDMDAELQALQSKRAKYQQIKQGMMQELLTGKTRLV